MKPKSILSQIPKKYKASARRGPKIRISVYDDKWIKRQAKKRNMGDSEFLAAVLQKVREK